MIQKLVFCLGRFLISQGLFEGWRCTSLHWLRLDDLHLGLKHRHECFFTIKVFAVLGLLMFCVLYIYMYFYCHFFLYSLLTLYWTLVHQEICCRFGCPVTSFVHSGLMLVPCKHVTTCIYSYRFSNKELLVDLHKHCLGNWVTQLSCGVTYLTSRTAMLTLGSLWLLHQVTNSTCSSLHVLIVL